MVRFSTPRGTEDILPDDWPYWNTVLGYIEDITRLYGYRRIQTPIFAETSLFARTSGQGTDVVDKEMYNFRDRGGDELTLRPEGTAPVMRAYFQHGMNKLPQPVKLYYVERMYRYDRPQRGRFREHHQFGCEAIGSQDAYVDVEMIDLLAELYRRVGFVDVSLHINSIGDKNCRPAYIVALVEYLRRHENSLADVDRERIDRNPLRVLDSKEQETQYVVARAPKMLDYLCDECRAHWDRLRHGLEISAIAYEVDFRLVRGLDYYTRTVFEFVPPDEGAQSVLGGGGRYDALSEAMGASSVPGVGFGAGIERLILRMKETRDRVEDSDKPTVFLAHLGPGAEDAALSLSLKLRQAHVSGVMDFGDRKLKAQLKHANAFGARFAVIIGSDELEQGQVAVRNLETGEQRLMLPDDVTPFVERSLGAAGS